MKEIAVISGKGGTGKTSLAGSFAALADRPVLADCDVDAADLHLILGPTIKTAREFSGGKRATVLADRCTGCGQCEEICRFGAVRRKRATDGTAPSVFEIDPVKCEGCGVCAWFCTPKAIECREAANGRWFLSDTRFGPMVHAELGVGEENSGKLVTLVRTRAREIAKQTGRNLIIMDGAPGIGCPVIASLTGADLAVIVTEPTVSGVHDLERMAELSAHFGIRTVICINKWDISPTVTASIMDKARTKGIPVISQIPYDKAVTKAQTMKATVVEHANGAITQEIRSAWQRVIAALA